MQYALYKPLTILLNKKVQQLDEILTTFAEWRSYNRKNDFI